MTIKELFDENNITFGMVERFGQGYEWYTTDCGVILDHWSYELSEVKPAVFNTTHMILEEMLSRGNE